MEQKSPFKLVFGEAPIVRVMDFLLENREFDYSITDIAKHADIGWSTLHGFWKELVALEIVIQTRRIGRAELYRLNVKSPIVKKLMEIDHEISKNLINLELKKQKLKAK